MSYLVYFMFEGFLEHHWFNGYTKKEIRSIFQKEYPGCKISSFEKRGF